VETQDIPLKEFEGFKLRRDSSVWTLGTDPGEFPNREEVSEQSNLQERGKSTDGFMEGIRETPLTVRSWGSCGELNP
jgi:hypothetical protein